MDENTKGIISASLVTLGLVVIAVSIAMRPLPNPSAPTVTVEGDTNPAPVVVSGTNQPYEYTAHESSLQPSEMTTFGGTTTLDSLKLSNDLTVGDNLIVAGDFSLTGALTATGALSVTGDITNDSVIHTDNSTFSSVTTTQTLVNLTNSGSVARSLIDVGCVFGTNTSGGTIHPTISTAYTTTATTGTGATLLYDGLVTLSVSSSTLTTTSSLMTTKTVWDPGETLQFLLASPTSSGKVTGECYATYYE